MNEDGTLTPAGKARYGTVDNFNRYMQNKERAREARREARRQPSVNRGRILLDKNRTRIGAVGRGIGRNIAVGTALGLGTTAVAALVTKGALDGKINGMSASLIASGTLGAAKILGIGYGGYNIYKTGRDVVDITRAKNAGYMRKKDRYIER